jgi:hypothetical protein
MTNAVQKEEVGYAWNYVADMGNGKQFSLSGNFPKGVSKADMDSAVDMISSVFNRQQAKAAAQGAGDEISQLELRLSSAIEDLQRINEKADAKNGLSAQERQQKEAAIAHVEKMQKDIDYKKGVLQKLKDEAK